ncbi:MAG: BrnT family toxin [bacterium]
MKVFRWNNEKNEWLRENRGVCFEEVVIFMERENVLEIVEHPNQDKYAGQKIAIIRIDDYVYLVPYKQEGEEIFLKTIIPSRKTTKKYERFKNEKDDFG